MDGDISQQSYPEGNQSTVWPTALPWNSHCRAHAGGTYLIYDIAYLPKNGSIGFPPMFKLSFTQKKLLGMSNLCPQGQPRAGRFLSCPTAAVSHVWDHPAENV